MQLFSESKKADINGNNNIGDSHRVEKMKDELNNHSHMLKEKHVELESARKELSVKNKLILQLKTDMHSLKNGNVEGVRKQQDMERLTNRVSTLTLECASQQERTQMLSYDKEILEASNIEMREKLDLMKRRFRSIMVD